MLERPLLTGDGGIPLTPAGSLESDRGRNRVLNFPSLLQDLVSRCPPAALYTYFAQPAGIRHPQQSIQFN
jgi:hypothetical protein